MLKYIAFVQLDKVRTAPYIDMYGVAAIIKY